MTGARQRLFDLFVGLAVGAVVCGAWVARRYERTFESMYLIEVADQAHVASEIAAGAGPALAERIRASLPAYARALGETRLATAAGRDWALWAVRDAYSAAGIAPPAEVDRLLSGLPPRARCAPPPGAAAPTSP